ncbi:MAG TPA: DUF45 domain-containing protein [Methanoculleus sp.]|nr:DUF45 domain-containing protein [Methanoculleus sp.]
MRKVFALLFAHPFAARPQMLQTVSGRFEYVVVHEMVHLLERNHTDRFRELMDQFMPQWRHYRDLLNQAPLSHETWCY